MDIPEIIGVISACTGCFAIAFSIYRYLRPPNINEEIRQHDDDNEIRRRELSIIEHLTERIGILIKRDQIK